MFLEIFYVANKYTFCDFKNEQKGTVLIDNCQKNRVFRRHFVVTHQKCLVKMLTQFVSVLYPP